MSGAALGRMPESVGLVTVDVEPDNVWTDTHSRGLTNIWALPAFHALCLEYGVRPTYLITYTVAEDRESAAIIERLLTAGNCEVGVHPHLWETPPLTSRDRIGPAWTGPAYKRDLLGEKLQCLYELIKRRFGAATSHRAGRYGLDARQVEILLGLGIEVDTSVTPGMDWSATGAPDYRAAPLGAYYLSRSGLTVPGDSALLEVPCTIRPGVRLGGLENTRIGRMIWSRLRLSPRPLRGLPSITARDLIAICGWGKDGSLPLNLMTHSSELCAGTSPYWKSENDVRRHLDMCAEVFGWWRKNGIVTATLTEFARSFRIQHS